MGWKITPDTNVTATTESDDFRVRFPRNDGNEITYTIKYEENGKCGSMTVTQPGSSGPGPEPPVGNYTVNIKLHNNYGSTVHIGGIYFYITPTYDVADSTIPTGVIHCGLGDKEGMDITIQNGGDYTIENISYDGCITYFTGSGLLVDNKVYWQNGPAGGDKACKVYTYGQHSSEEYLVDNGSGLITNGGTYTFNINPQ